MAYGLWLSISVVHAQLESFYVSPLCTIHGEITCPIGFEVACSNGLIEDTQPKCVFLGRNYVPGCWKFVGINKLDFILPGESFAQSAMVKITGRGETYNLNRETIGCKKL